MSKLFEILKTGDTLTKNGAITHSTSNDYCLDLFFLAGSCREESDSNIISILQKAYSQDKIKTLKIIFWSGDIREGAGERRFFRIALKFLEDNYTDVLEKLYHLVPEYNRWDSLFHLKSEKVLNFIHFFILSTNGEKDLNVLNLQKEYNEFYKEYYTFYKKYIDSNLLAKWMPRRYNKEFKDFRISFQKKFKLNDANYRKLISKFSKTVEQQMSKKEWNKINYEQVPSVASNKYRKAFIRHDKVRYTKYIEDVKNGDKKINASAIFPYDIYRSFKRGDNQDSIIAQWNSLPNYLENSNERILPICDVSWSMSGLPMDISISLGIYISERNKSIFKDGFITFSDNPTLQILKGNLCERIRQLESSEWNMSTNFEKVFSMLLTKAIQNKLPEDQMPTILLCISDMEFNEASDNSLTNYEIIKKTYEESGYKMPLLVFWNVNSSVSNYPIKSSDHGILISGSSPSILKGVLSGKLNPIDAMNSVIETERYKILETIL